ncbi:MAG TPA: lysophospholipid acyltransferase family protein [Rectinemataceae bacterium]|nr:lysophospholipid acyltransferase family protein [Rectinemataceae bacterium]
MKSVSRLVSPLVKLILGAVCTVDGRELEKLPRTGPLIVVINHINFLEVPLLYTYLYPRDLVGMVKRETWDNPIIGALAWAWDAISLDRESTDLTAMRKAGEALRAGRILAMAPEGTRSGHGRLQRGRAGIVMLARRENATIVPVAHYGGERFWENLRSFRKTRFVFKVGESFKLRPPAPGEGRRGREEATDEIMRRLARLLPPEYRGAYADDSEEERHLLFG